MFDWDLAAISLIAGAMTAVAAVGVRWAIRRRVVAIYTEMQRTNGAPVNYGPADMANSAEFAMSGFEVGVLTVASVFPWIGTEAPVLISLVVVGFTVFSGVWIILHLRTLDEPSWFIKWNSIFPQGENSMGLAGWTDVWSVVVVALGVMLLYWE